jgi:hypothetical protein
LIIAAAGTLSGALADVPVHVYHAMPPAREAAASAEGQKDYFGECQAEVRKIAARYEVPDSLVRVEAGAVESSLPAYARESRANAV